MLKIRFSILSHFQHWINVIWMVIYNVETMLIQCWNVGRTVSMKKLTLRNSVPATLLTKWNLYVFFKNFAKIFSTSVSTNFFWWLLLRIHLRLVVLVFKRGLFKACVCYFFQIIIFSSNDSPSETMKNVFCFIQKALFILQILKFF